MLGKIIDFIDGFLNKTTMYRLVLYYLLTLFLAAEVLSFFNVLRFSPIDFLFSVLILVDVCVIVNYAFGRVFKAHRNVESVYITALILALIISPVKPNDFSGVAFLIWAGAIAMASKYIVALRKKHIFNPAAFAVALTAFTIGKSATWWVGGNLTLLPLVLIGGLLVLRKVQRFDLAIGFFIAAMLTIAYFSLYSISPLTVIFRSLIYSPIFYFAFVMLTEPLTTPPNRRLRIMYGVFTGFLFTPQIHIGSIYSTPELALLVGNVFSYLVSPKWRYFFKLEEKKNIGTGAYDFIFTSDRKPYFNPGQYLEWTLPHSNPDSRGNRRYFTLASSPTEKKTIIGIKFYPEPSSFKKTLYLMKGGDEISASQLAGDFVLPEDKQKKLVFIAGGIGVTPFRSMVKYLLDIKEKRSIVFFYSNKTADEAAYSDIFNQAEKNLGIKMVYLITNEQKQLPSGTTYNSYLTEEIIRKEVEDYKRRTFYVSGPRGMVVAFKKILFEMGVSRKNIKTDFFPGFV